MFPTADDLQAMPVNWWPYFDLCHFVLAALAVRKEVGLPFSRTHPLATWIATLTASFAGSLIANPLLGKPVFGAISNETNLAVFSAVWWAIFYSPADVVYQVVTNEMVYYPICVVKEIYRAKKTMGGILDASKVFPDQELIQVMVGVIKGNGSAFIKPVTRLVCGLWRPDSSELLGLSVTSKACLVAALLFVADRTGMLPAPLSGDMLYLCTVATFVVVKLANLQGRPVDPFKPLDYGAALVTGDLWKSNEKEE